MSVKMIYGDITKQDHIQVIAHQCNCISILSAYLAKTMFTEFPWSDIYKERVSEKIDIKNFPKGKAPGDVRIRGNGKDQRYVANLLGQVFPGRSCRGRFPGYGIDTSKKRIEYFRDCLDKLADVKGLKSIAFPHGIGCGAAGGDWTVYKNMIFDFSDRVEGKEVEVFIAKLED